MDTPRVFRPEMFVKDRVQLLSTTFLTVAKNNKFMNLLTINRQQGLMFLITLINLPIKTTINRIMHYLIQIEYA